MKQIRTNKKNTWTINKTYGEHQETYEKQIKNKNNPNKQASNQANKQTKQTHKQAGRRRKTKHENKSKKMRGHMENTKPQKKKHNKHIWEETVT